MNITYDPKLIIIREEKKDDIDQRNDLDAGALDRQHFIGLVAQVFDPILHMGLGFPF